MRNTFGTRTMALPGCALRQKVYDVEIIDICDKCSEQIGSRDKERVNAL